VDLLLGHVADDNSGSTESCMTQSFESNIAFHGGKEEMGEVKRNELREMIV